jgi:hypothetical protein
MKLIIRLLFGQRAKGEPLPEPSIRSIYPEQRPDEQQWSIEFKFGSRYGHRGSFYHG